MNIINEKVEHIKFGLGVITGVEDNRIVAEFQDNIGVKMFQYPEAFEKFLKAENPAVQEDAMEKLRIKQEQIEQEMEKKRREIEEAELEKKREKIALAKKKPAARSTKKK